MSVQAQIDRISSVRDQQTALIEQIKTALDGKAGGSESTGVEVQTASGSAKTSSKGLLTLNIGFQPDLIVLKVGTVSGYEYNLNLALTEKWTTSKAGCTSWYGDEYVYEAYVNSVGTTSTTLYVYGYDSSWNSGAASDITFNWKAVKYTA